MKILGLFLILTSALSLTSCSKSPTTDKTQTIESKGNFQRMEGSFGFKLGDFGKEIESEAIEGCEPFRSLSVDVVEGRICQITAFGYTSELTEKRILISTLSEKYGERKRTAIEENGAHLGTEEHYFGTQDRIIHLIVDESYSNTTFNVEYRDSELMKKYYREMDAKDTKQEKEKRNKMSHSL